MICETYFESLEVLLYLFDCTGFTQQTKNYIKINTPLKCLKYKYLCSKKKSLYYH